MITRFRVQNYKALRDVTLDLTPIHVLIGPNDSGKTSILEAIAALSRTTCRPLNECFGGRWSGAELASNLTDSNDVVFEAGCAAFDYQLKVRMPRQGHIVENAGEWLRAPGADWSALHGSDTKTAVCHSMHQNNMGIPEEASQVGVALGHVRLHRWIPSHLALPVALDASRRYRMHSTGLGLVLCLDDILGYDRDHFTELEDRFRQLFPDVTSIKLKQEQAYLAPFVDSEEIPMLSKADGKGIYFQIKGSKNLIPAGQMSDGILLVLAYLTLFHLPEPPRFLLVEEPENGIHPGRLKDVLNILREIVTRQSHTQVILTTHSPYVVDLFQPEEVTLCYKGSDGAVQVRRLSESAEVRKQIDFFTLGEIWTGAGDEKLLEKASTEEQVETGP